MKQYRSIVALLLVLVTMVCLNLGSVAEAKSIKQPSYSVEQMASLKQYVAQVSALRDRMSELSALIQKQDWIFTRNFIHGPLGELRFQLATVTRNLLPPTQVQARNIARAIAEDMETIDQAAQNRDYKLAIRNYGQMVRDLDSFLTLIPQA